VAVTTVPALDTVREFPTPEHIAFQFRLAGPGARTCAYLLDLAIRFAVIAALGVVLSLVGVVFAGIAQGLLLVAWFVLEWVASALCEWLWNGRTPGKAALGIRVVGADGLPAGFGACVLRNLLRAADWLPFGFAAGIASMALSPSFQRLGDLAAGTIVIYSSGQRRGKPLVHDEAVVKAAQRIPAEVVAALDGQAARALAQYVQRRRRYGPARRAEIAAHLAAPLAARFALRVRDPDLLLCAVHHLMTNGQGASGMAGRAVALINERRPHWRRLDELIAQPSRGAADRPVELARLYRSACADLALAEAYHLPRAEVDRLHELVAGAHLRFYRRIAVSWRRVAWLTFVRVPALLYGDGCMRTAIGCFFGLFTLAWLAAMADPELAERYLGEQLEQFRDMYASPPQDRDLDEGAAAHGFYIRNNVGIALGSFATGIFAGIGSLFTLVFNGLFLGLVFGAMAAGDEPMRAHFFEFTAAHGPFELVGITIAGAAGLRLGLGLIVRRGLPRLESLRRSAAESVPIIAVAAFLVAAAAPIEAYVSPSALPVGIKRLVGVLCALLLVGYLIGLGRRGRGVGAHLPGARPPGLAADAAEGNAT